MKLPNLKNIGKLFTTGGVIIGYDSWRRSITQVDPATAVKDIVQTEMNKTRELMVDSTVSSVAKTRLTAQKSIIQEDYTSAMSSAQKYSQAVADKSSTVEYHKDEFFSKMDKLEKSLKDLNDTINQIKNKFLDDFKLQDLIDKYNDFLSNLNSDQLCKVITILSCWLILLCLFDILIIFIGNQIIDYLKLESNYPKIVKFIKLRKKYQDFNLFINFLIISSFLIFTIYINIVTLVHFI
jgi:hypothetical protein